MLKQKDLKRATLIEACIKGECTVKQVAIALGLSERRVKQIKKEVKENGVKSIQHGNRGRKPKNALTDEFKTEIELLYTNKYFDCTYTKFKEFLETRENINLSIDEIRVILRDRYIFSPRTHKSTKRKFRKKLEKEIKTAKKKELEKIKKDIFHTKLIQENMR